MASIKLEDNIREKLEARELKPLTGAWEKLESKLDKKQPNKKSVLWYYIAASFIGILILASVFFSRNTNTPKKTQIVKENVEPKENTHQKNKIIPKTINKEKIVSEENNSDKIKIEKKQRQLPLKNVSSIDKKYQKAEAITKASNQQENPTKEKPQQSIEKQVTVISDSASSLVPSKTLAEEKEDKLIKNKVAEVVASVKKLQDINTKVTAAEVDALLKNARHEIQTQRILNNPKVDATALLQDVEWELEKSFRNKVLDALGEGFQKVRTAVAERNN